MPALPVINYSNLKSHKKAEVISFYKNLLDDYPQLVIHSKVNYINKIRGKHSVKLQKLVNLNKFIQVNVSASSIN